MRGFDRKALAAPGQNADNCRRFRRNPLRLTALATLAALLLAPVANAARHFDTLGAGRGLGAMVVTSLRFDRDGLLWVGSREGLFRYDGYQAAAFLPDLDRPGHISDVDVRSLYEADDGALWVATNTGGLNRRDPRTRPVHAIPSRLQRPAFAQRRERLRRRPGCRRHDLGRNAERPQPPRSRRSRIHALFPRSRRVAADRRQLGLHAAPRCVPHALDWHRRRRHRPLGCGQQQVPEFLAREARGRPRRARRRIRDSRGVRRPRVGRHAPRTRDARSGSRIRRRPSTCRMAPAYSR